MYIYTYVHKYTLSTREVCGAVRAYQYHFKDLHIQGGEDPSDSLSSFVIFRKRAL